MQGERKEEAQGTDGRLIPNIVNVTKTPPQQGGRGPETEFWGSVMDGAWRGYATAAITGMANQVTADEVSDLCALAAAIADEMVRQEAERESDVDGKGKTSS